MKKKKEEGSSRTLWESASSECGSGGLAATSRTYKGLLQEAISAHMADQMQPVLANEHAIAKISTCRVRACLGQ